MLPNKLLGPGAYHPPGLGEPGDGRRGTTAFWMKDYNGFIDASSGHFSMAWGSLAKESTTQTSKPELKPTSLELWQGVPYPADTQRKNDVIMSSKGRHDVILTS